MSSTSIWILVAAFTACFMELWAAALHKLIWHRALWRVHRTHHRKRHGALEANDALSVLHAPIAIALILYGCVAAPGPVREVAYGVGVGMTAFGVAYAVVHDGLVHGRLPVAFLERFAYFRRVKESHNAHHIGGRDRAPYGLFLGPWELARAARAQRHEAFRSASRARPKPQLADAHGPSPRSTSP